MCGNSVRHSVFIVVVTVFNEGITIRISYKIIINNYKRLEIKHAQRA